MKKYPFVKRFLWFLIVAFIGMNIVAYFHAYKFTHFVDSNIVKTKDPKELPLSEKINILFTGINNPKPVNQALPAQKFETISLQSNKKIECWAIQTDSIAKGTVILFHGYSGDKSKMLDKSEVFLTLGYNTLLVDFMGSGGSEGNQTTIGFYEAEEVNTCMEYLQKQGEKNIYLFGTSMGAAAVLKAVANYKLNPSAIIVECPFGSMYQTTCARFEAMHVPPFPMAGLLLFWGGIQNDFWAFGHNPSTYAEQVSCPTLLMYGEKDARVSRGEIDAIFANLKGKKQLQTYPLAAHENYLIKYKDKWTEDIRSFLIKQENNTNPSTKLFQPK